MYAFFMASILNTPKTQTAGEGQWEKINLSGLPRWTRAAEGHVSPPSLMGHGQAQGAETQEEKEPRIWKFPPLKSVLPAHVEDWAGEEVEGMLKHFLRTHKSLLDGFPLARGSSGGGVYFLLPTLKKLQKPMGP